MKIARAVLFTNGMVAVFDEEGHQMSEYQGHYGEVVAKIRDAGYWGDWLLAQWDHRQSPNPWVGLATFQPYIPPVMKREG